MTAGQIVLLVAVACAVLVGGWRLVGDGRFRGTRRTRGVAERAVAERAGVDLAGSGPEPGPAPGVARALAGRDLSLGERATLLQFSSAFCAPCRATRRVLGEVAVAVPGVAHVELDAESHLELVRELGILRTPTTLVLDGRGHEVRRAAGAPRRQDVLAALAEAVSS